MSLLTSLDDAVVKSSANGLKGTGFTSGYWLQTQQFFKGPWVGVTPIHPLLFISI